MMVRVLLIEDDPDLALISSAALGVAGLDVVTAGSVAAAVEVCGAEQPAVAVVDLQLPDGTGWDFIRWARAHRPDLRVVVTSVHLDDPLNVAEGRRLSVDRLVPKSGDPSDLVAPVRELLGV